MGAERSLILTTSVGALFHTALLFSVFLLFAGHNAPGGGFVGGLVAGAALVLRYVDGGAETVRRVVRVEAPVLLGAGIALAVLTGALPWLAGGQFLESAAFDLEVGPLHLHGTSALPFDIGVYLVVVGLVLGIVEHLGGEADG